MATDTKALEPRENEALRQVVEDLVKDLGSQTKAAKALGISQPFLSDFLKGNRGAGTKLLVGVAAYRRDAVMGLLGLPQPVRDNIHHPNLLEALSRSKGIWSERTVAYAAVIAQAWSVDRSLGAWTDELEAYDQAHKGLIQRDVSTPNSSGVVRKTPARKAR